ALGQRRYSASAMKWLTSESPRNSSRSLCGLPALRWVSACASSAGSEKRYPANAASDGSFSSTGARQQLLRMELPDDIKIQEQRLATFVIHRHQPAVAVALEFENI